MFRVLILAVSCVWFVGCATSERIVPTTIIIPEDAANTTFVDLYPKLRQLAWRSTEAYYRDDWKELSESAQAIEKAARVLRSTKDAPARLTNLPVKCDALATEAVGLRSAASGPEPEQIGDRLQKIHNLIRELRPDA